MKHNQVWSPQDGWLLHAKLCVCPWISLESFTLIIIIIKVFVKCKIFSLETILSAHTHAHTDRHPHTRALQLYKARYTLLKMGSKQRIDEDIYIYMQNDHTGTSKILSPCQSSVNYGTSMHEKQTKCNMKCCESAWEQRTALYKSDQQ